MNNKHQLRLTALAAIVAASLAGCSDGSDGKAGEPGRPGGTPATSISELNLSVNNVDFGAATTEVTFLATNQDDQAVIGLTDVRVQSTQLRPEGETGTGDASSWQFVGYTSDLVDQQNGYYVATIDNTANYGAHNPHLTQRINLIAYEGTLQDGTTAVPHQEYSVDLDAQGGAAKFTRDIVGAEACAQCHGDFIAQKHGGKYGDVETCVTCHDGLKAEGGRSNRTLQTIAHDVHLDAGLSSSFNDCSTCHLQDEQLADWGNWMSVPTQESCFTCHEPVHNYEDNAQCASCHTAEGTGVARGIREVHLAGFDTEVNAQDSVAISIDDARYLDADAGAVELTVSVRIDGQPITDTAMFSKLRVLNNFGANQDYLDSGYVRTDLPQPAADGSITVQVTDAKLAVTDATEITNAYVDARVCTNAGVISACNDDSQTVDIRSEVAFFDVDGLASEGRRHVVSVDNCTSCHDANQGVKHYGMGYDQGCQSCHNAGLGFGPGDDVTEALLNSSDYKLMIHTLHADNRPRRTEAGANVTNYPAPIADCTQCHDGATFGTADIEGAAAVKTAQGFTSPAAAACASCHSDNVALTHMEQVGNATFGNADSAVGVETCSFCHDINALTASHKLKI